MTDTMKVNGEDSATKDSPMQALSMLFGDTVKQLVGTAESQQVAILALTSMLIMTPGVAEIDVKRVAVIVQALTQNRKDAEQIRARVATYMSMVVNMANKLPEAIAAAEANQKH